MYRYERRGLKVKKIIMSLILALSISIGSIAVYTFYLDTTEIAKIENNDIEIEKLSQNMVLDIPKKDISKIVEETLKTVVGVSKIKSNGTSIFRNK